jgi:hypothetical protein
LADRASADKAEDKNEDCSNAGKINYIKNSLKRIRDIVFGKYPREKFFIGSFLIVALVGVISIRALATSDHLIAWAPEQTDFYLHLKKNEAGIVWQKIKNIQLFPEIKTSLSQLLPVQTNEFSLFGNQDSYAILLESNEQPLVDPPLEVREMEPDVYLISFPDFPALKKKTTATIAKQQGLAAEPINSQGYLFIDPQKIDYLSDMPAAWQQSNQPLVSAWSLHIEDEIIIWKNIASSEKPTPLELANQFIPQNTNFWTHGDNWQKTWENSLNLLPPFDTIQVAGQTLTNRITNSANPESSFLPLFSAPYDLIVNQNSKTPNWTLTLAKKPNSNPLWINNFEEFWLNSLKKSMPVYKTIILPDNSRAVELHANDRLSWYQQNINNKTIHWLQNSDQSFLIGYLELENKIILSNNYANLIDFLYLEKQNGWIDIAKISEKCHFNPNEIKSYYDFKVKEPKISQIFKIIGPILVNSEQTICHF